MSRINSLKVQFKNANQLLLDARLELPTIEPKAYAIFCHCFTCTKQTLATFRISRQLAEYGIAVLRFDFTGLGHSEGDFDETNFTTMVNDVISAATYLKDNYVAPTFIIGHSLGGTAALAASLNIDSISAVITIASPSKPDHVLHHFGSALTELENGRTSQFNVAGTSYPMKPQFINDVRSYNTQSLFSEIQIPTLIFNVQGDTIVEETNAIDINHWVGGSSKLITLQNTDHLLSNKNTIRFVSDNIIKWTKI